MGWKLFSGVENCYHLAYASANFRDQNLRISMKTILGCLVAVSCLASAASTAIAAEVNVYSARSEALIKPLLDKFTKETGVTVNLVTGKADLLITRMQREGKFSPVDVLITTDVGRLHRASESELLQPLDMSSVDGLVPAYYRDSDAQWVGLTKRARPIMYLPSRVKPSELSSVFDLADDKWRGRVCIRSSSNIYNQSMIAAMIELHGEEKVQTWAEQFVLNFARQPKGGDRDQIKALVAGECDVAIANTYYLAGMATSNDVQTVATAEQVKVIWPDQVEGAGAHVNISGAGIAKHSKNIASAQALIEYMLTPESQQWYAESNQEYPIIANVPWSAKLQEYGQFDGQSIILKKVGERNGQAVKLMDKAGWK